MNVFFVCVLIGISLSMDAFSLALIYGTYGLSRRNEIVLSIVVGIFHFVMPLLGLFFGSIIIRNFLFDVHILMGIIFGIIGIEMIISSTREEEVKVLLNFWGFLLFGLSVSIDSLTTGIGLSAISYHYFLIAGIFMIISGMFTFIGLRLGNKLVNKIGKYATIGGGVMMVLLAIHYIL